MSQNRFHGDWEESERFAAALLDTRERNARTCAPSYIHPPHQYHVQQTADQNVSCTTTNQAAANEEPTDDADDAAAADTKTGSKMAQKQAAAEDDHNSKSKTRKNKPKNSK
jgi:hypothetical protein